MNSVLTPGVIFGIVAAYFGVLMIISWLTSKNSSNKEFFLAGRKSPWYLVAFGMIGASLSGVTFISIPGAVGSTPETLELLGATPSMKGNIQFSYMQMVLGYLVGYLVIGTVLLPLYYKLNLTSIYGYLEKRFGVVSYKTGAAFFILSRTIGASFRLYLVAVVFQFIFDQIPNLDMPFWLTVFMTILLIWIYTFRGGIKTIVWTDTLQTICMLAAVILTIVYIGKELDAGVVETVRESRFSQMFFFEGGWGDPNNFFKQFIGGALIALVMTGLDQDMMQKNLSCRNLGDAQKNMFSFSIVLVFVNVIFLALGALLFIYAFDSPETLEGLKGLLKTKANGDVYLQADKVFPMLALNHLPWVVGAFFILGLIAAAYSSADSALTSLTTSFCVDFLGFEKKEEHASEEEKKALKRTRFMVHIGFSFLLMLVILVFKAINDDSVVTQLFIAAGFTYGPILGLFAFGILTKRSVNDPLVLVVCIAAPIICFVLNKYSADLFNGFKFGFLIIALNGLRTFLGLLLISSAPRGLKTK